MTGAACPATAGPSAPNRRGPVLAFILGSFREVLPSGASWSMSRRALAFTGESRAAGLKMVTVPLPDVVISGRPRCSPHRGRPLLPSGPPGLFGEDGFESRAGAGDRIRGGRQVAVKSAGHDLLDRLLGHRGEDPQASPQADVQPCREIDLHRPSLAWFLATLFT